jgi:homoserine O-succinyltransferase
MNAISAREALNAPALEIALVNNMPDQAVDATRAQFVKLLRAGAQGAPFRLHCYLLPSVPHSEAARRALLQSYEDIEALYVRGADALIVTGSEPRADNLEDEPYWGEFSRLVDWARTRTNSALWSCLAAHGAVLRLDGLTRRRAREKISGVFACEVTPNDWAMREAVGQILVPHSRYNGLSHSDLIRSGYHISSWSQALEVDCFWRREPSLFLFTQGHPEYDADTLAREFRRDALRFWAGERDCFPSPPTDYFSAKTKMALDDLHALGNFEDRPRLAQRLNQILGADAPASTWWNDATRLYSNWLAVIAVEKMQKRQIVATA